MRMHTTRQTGRLPLKRLGSRPTIGFVSGHLKYKNSYTIWQGVVDVFNRVNKALAAHVGLTDPAELIGKNDFDYYPEDRARPTFEQAQAIMRTGQPFLNLEEPGGVGPTEGYI